MLRHAKSQSCPFCRDSLKRMNSGELWIYPSKCDITDLPTIAKENLKRLFLYIEKLPLIVPNSMVVSYDLHSWRKVWFSVVSCTEHTSGDIFYVILFIHFILHLSLYIYDLGSCPAAAQPGFQLILFGFQYSFHDAKVWPDVTCTKNFLLFLGSSYSDLIILNCSPCNSRDHKFLVRRFQMGKDYSNSCFVHIF